MPIRFFYFQFVFAISVILTSAAPLLAIEPQEETLVEDTPLELFTDRAQGWNYQSLKKENLSDNSLYETLAKVPGVFVQGETSGGNPSVRIRAANSISRNLILFDGTPLNMGDGTGPSPILLPMELIDTIDVMKGPSSTFYGSSAVGGAINLKPKKFQKYTLRFGQESFGKKNFFAAAPILKSDKNHLQTSLFLEKTQGNFEYDDETAGRTKRQNNFYNRQRYSLLGEHKLAQTIFQHQFIYAYDNGNSPGQTPYARTNVTDYDRRAFLASLGAKTSVAKNLTGSLKSSYLQTKSTNVDSSTGNTDYFVSKNINTGALEYNWDKHNFEFLTDFYVDRFKNKTLAPNQQENHFEHALLYRSTLTESESVSAGLRYFPDQNETVKNILLKQNNEKYILWASYSEGLKIPTFTERFMDTGYFTGNPGLDVEKSNQVELGVEKPFGNGDNFWDETNAKLSIYTIEYKNFIQFVSTPAPYSYENLQTVEAYGADSTFRWNYKIYHSQLSYSFINTEDTSTHREILLVPNHQVYLLLGAQMSFIITELHNTYWSSYRTTDTKDEPSWLSTDLTFRTSGLTSWNFQTGVKNIFNNRKSLTEGYPEPGRSYFAYAEKTF